MTKIGKNGPARIVCFGEILFRLASHSPKLLFQDMQLEASVCGAEANVSVGLAGFGHACRIVSALPANPLGVAARTTIEAFGPEVAGPTSGSSRMGLFFLQPGAMARPASVIYDRAGSAFANADPSEYDWDSLLAGAEWLFVSGITAALGDMALAALRHAMGTARDAGVKIAFDTNFRPTLWQGREALAAQVLRELSCEADLLFAGRRATAMMAGGTFDHADPADGFHAAAETMFALSPHLKHMTATRRHVYSTDRQDLTGLLADREGISVSKTLALEQIVDRVGTGDAFAAGVLHGLLEGKSRDETINFAAASAQWAHSVPGDFLRATVADIEDLSRGGSDVKR